MKRTLTLLAATLIAVSSFAQTNTNDQLKHEFISFVQTVQSNRSITVALYPSYAPDIVVNGKKDTFGFGLALLAPASLIPSLDGTAVGNHAFAGIRLDYQAHQAFASTIGVGLKGDFQILGHNFTAFTHAGANIPFAGFGIKNGELGAMAGGGVYTTLFKIGTRGSLGLQVSAEKWTQFPGVVFHGGPVFNLSF